MSQCPFSWASTCPPLSGMTSYGDGSNTKWYKHGPEPVTFDQAVNYCQGLGEVTLATVSTLEDLENFQQYVDSQFLAGWADIKNPEGNSCQSSIECEGSFQTSNGAPVSSDHLPENMQVDGGADVCLAIEKDEGIWSVKSENCEDIRIPVCISECGAESNSAACSAPTGVSSQLVGSKYFYTSSDRHTIGDSISYCDNLAGGGKFKLARLHTKNDFDTLVEYIENDKGTYMVDLHNPILSDCRDHLECDNQLSEKSDPSITIPTAHMTGLVSFFPVPTTECMQFKVLVEQVVKLDGNSCDDTNFVICEGLSCDGGWSDWSLTPGGCSVTCGQGVTEETRSCDNPVQGTGGMPCIGPDRRVQVCDTGEECPNNVEVSVGGGWGDWGPWTSCSKGCDHGVRQKRRLFDDQCLEYDQDGLVVQYCSETECTGLSRGWNFTPYWISETSKEDFLTNAQTVSPPTGNSIDLKMFCGHQCLKMRKSSLAADPTTCNSFMVRGGQCHLGSVTTQWVVNRRVAPSGGHKRVYVDFSILKCD